MPFNYSKIEYKNAEDNKNYFLDANIWLKVLFPKNNPSRKDRLYRDFFDRIVSNNKSRIVVPALILSEVINRVLREVYYGKHLAKIRNANPTFNPDKDYYKNVFRNTEDFRIGYALICDEIKNYHGSISLINDGLGSDFRFKDILKNLPAGLDFNDHYYYKLCKKHNYSLLTDDKDFWVEDVEILTESETLYNKFISQKIS